ncbi:hypothetical protein WJX84_008325 [Apatococcus fuscideae]|uniref:Uncharacterized protein n=1 Tax=Apatococcus fuscideae TaxID=2026836 RepID=A0AAW1SW83_9CHLO
MGNHQQHQTLTDVGPSITVQDLKSPQLGERVRQRLQDCGWATIPAAQLHPYDRQLAASTNEQAQQYLNSTANPYIDRSGLAPRPNTAPHAKLTFGKSRPPKSTEAQGAHHGASPCQSAWGESLSKAAAAAAALDQASGRSALLSRGMRQTTNADVNNQVYPTWAKRSPDLAEAFQDWVRRARLYYGEVEAAAAIQGMDRFLEAASLEDRTAVLAELRRLHVMADPHRWKSATHRFFDSKTLYGSGSTAAAEREYMKAKFEGSQPPRPQTAPQTNGDPAADLYKSSIPLGRNAGMGGAGGDTSAYQESYGKDAAALARSTAKEAVARKAQDGKHEELVKIMPHPRTHGCQTGIHLAVDICPFWKAQCAPCNDSRRALFSADWVCGPTIRARAGGNVG